MKLTFRWYGGQDPVSLENIRQIPNMSGIVSAVYHTPVGEVWQKNSIQKIKEEAQKSGLAFEVVESVPVHENIKLGTPDAPQLISNYCETLKQLGETGVRVVCYNFMPVFDWFRSSLDTPLPDGSNALSYDASTVNALHPGKGDFSLPGWDESYKKEELRALLDAYRGMDEERLWKNLETFLSMVIPAAEQSGIRMAIHPDDPPWGIFGLPRIITSRENLKRFLKLADSPANGITLCTGSLGADPANDLCQIIYDCRGRIPFVHLRNIRYTGNKSFSETAHPSACGDLDMFEIIHALYRTGFNGYIRPDHGRMIWGETGRPGYGLYDRALGAAYIQGLWEAIEKIYKLED